MGGKMGVSSLWLDLCLHSFLPLLFVGLVARAVGGGEVVGVAVAVAVGVLAGAGGGGGKKFYRRQGGGEGREAKRGADGLVAVGELVVEGGGESGGLEGGGDENGGRNFEGESEKRQNLYQESTFTFVIIKVLLETVKIQKSNNCS